MEVLVQILKSENKNAHNDLHPTIVGALTYVEKFRDQPIVVFFANIRHTGHPVSRILTKKCHYRLVPELLHICRDLLQKIHGWDMNCPSDVATCAVFTAQVDNNHILLIPKLGHTTEIQRMHNVVATCGNETRENQNFP